MNPFIEPKPVRVYEAICGTGKSTFLRNIVNQEQDKLEEYSRPFLVILPDLDEVDKYLTECPGVFTQPVAFRGSAEIPAYSKRDHAKLLLKQGSSIVTTHALFKRFSQSMKEAIVNHEYSVWIDEEVDSVSVDQVKRDVINDLIKMKYVMIDEDDGMLTWNHKMTGPAYDGADEFLKIRKLVTTKDVYLYTPKKRKKGVDSRLFFIWTIPKSLFQLNADVRILTYRFKYSILASFFKAEGVPFVVDQINPERALLIKQSIKDRLEIIEPTRPMMKQGVGYGYAFSHGWYEYKINGGKAEKRYRDKRSIHVIRKAQLTFLQRQGFTEDNSIWAVPKDFRTQTRDGKHFQISTEDTWVPFNIRGTTQYKDKTFMYYAVNVYMNPALSGYLTYSSDEKFDTEEFALSQLIQALFRTNLRDPNSDTKIKVFIPSDRMRNLLKKWVEK